MIFIIKIIVAAESAESSLRDESRDNLPGVCSELVGGNRSRGETLHSLLTLRHRDMERYFGLAQRIRRKINNFYRQNFVADGVSPDNEPW